MPRKKPVKTPNPTAFSLNPVASVDVTERPEAVIKREVSTWGQIDTKYETIIYGEGDNLPQRIAQAVAESPAALACINTVSKYIKGSKFSSEALMKLKIDKYGTTLWQFHTKLCDTLALFKGFSVNFKFNREGKITNAYPMAFESCRLGKPDDLGFINRVKFNPYFGYSRVQHDDNTDTYPLFDAKEVLNQIENEGKKFKGQVYYYGKTSPVYKFYPVPEYWSAKNWINIDGRIQEFHSSNLDKGFFQTLVWYVIGDPNEPSPNPKDWKEYTDENGVKRRESLKTVGQAFNEMMAQTFAGSNKSGGGIVQWAQNKETATRMEAVPTNQNHDLFTTLQDLTTKNITVATQVPGILANISEGTNLGSGGSEIQKAVELMQSNTKEERNLLEQFYNEVLLPNLAVQVNEPVEIVNYTPVTVPVEIDDKFWEVMDQDEKRDFIRKNVPGITLKEPTVQAPAPTVDPTTGEVAQPEPTQVNSALRNLGIRELEKIQKIVSRYNLYLSDPNNTKGVSYEQAKQLLAPFGFTEEELNAWLVKPEEI